MTSGATRREEAEGGSGKSVMAMRRTRIVKTVVNNELSVEGISERSHAIVMSDARDLVEPIENRKHGRNASRFLP